MARALMFLALGLPALPLAVGLVLFWRGRGPRWWRGLGWVALWSAPAALIQVGAVVGGGEPLFERAAVLPVSWWVLSGGGVCAWFFESSLAAADVGRRSTMVDHAPYLLFLVGLFTAAAATVAAQLLPSEEEGRGGWRRRLARTPPGAWVIGAIVGLNAFAAVAWPWWGA